MIRTLIGCVFVLSLSHAYASSVKWVQDGGLQRNLLQEKLDSFLNGVGACR